MLLVFSSLAVEVIGVFKGVFMVPVVI
ncbi:hypothetical protein E2C01_079673 [Portunus trituberculatus]|uniref:Uncharacterized protein n=1 Tax=Portunus trituberculatus TaxID=210409 RepID=A0A5B7IK63_PORTR|nr:hypothetical protein [Portunus trituberculatus]